MPWLSSLRTWTTQLVSQRCMTLFFLLKYRSPEGRRYRIVHVEGVCKAAIGPISIPSYNFLALVKRSSFDKCSRYSREICILARALVTRTYGEPILRKFLIAGIFNFFAPLPFFSLSVAFTVRRRLPTSAYSPRRPLFSFSPSLSSFVLFFWIKMSASLGTRHFAR